MAYLNDLFDLNLFREMLERKFVRVQTSTDGKLSIANYSELAQFDRAWNEVTLNCRGLIYDTETLEVVARGFKKFFNWDDSSQPFPPTGPCLRMPKMDGSLGIMYYHPKDGIKIATRGSFTSDQAIKATEMALETLRQNPDLYCPVGDGYTPLFEIIYPENRIVVDYGQEEKLVLLDVIDNATGKADLAEFDMFTWPHKVEKLSLPGFQDTMASDIPQGEEGFVFYWPQKDFRVKMKAAEYIEIHRMIFGLNARSVWQRMGDGETVEEIAEKLPDEFHPWVKDIGGDLIKKQNRIFSDVLKEFGEALRSYKAEDPSDKRAERKAFAERVKASPLKSYLFLFFDNPGGERVKEAIWADLRPAGNIGVTTISEDVA